MISTEWSSLPLQGGKRTILQLNKWYINWGQGQNYRTRKNERIEGVVLNKNLLILVLLLVAAVAVGAGLFLKKGDNTTPQSGPSKPAKTTEKPKGVGPIAVIPKGTTHSFWNSVLAGAQKAAKEHNVEIFWTGPDREGDREKQIQIVEDFIVKKVAGIVLAPTDARASSLWSNVRRPPGYRSLLSTRISKPTSESRL